MTARNSSYMIYDTQADSALVVGPLRDFIPEYGSLNDYDPKVIYDPMEDRFVLIFLLGNAPPSTYIVTCFPETSDPTGDWNVYFLDGDPFSTGHWSDYPAIALSEEELFITINLLVPGGSWQTSFHQTLIWQIDKLDGYGGNPTLNSVIWEDNTEGGINIRNMHPVRGGIYPKGPNQFFCPIEILPWRVILYIWLKLRIQLPAAQQRETLHFYTPGTTIILLLVPDNPYQTASKPMIQECLEEFGKTMKFISFKTAWIPHQAIQRFIMVLYPEFRGVLRL